MGSIRHEVIIDTDAPARRPELRHENLERYGTVFNTVAPGTELTGVLRSKKGGS